MNHRLTLSTSPHLSSHRDVRRVMYIVILTLLPALFWGFYLFRTPAVIITLTAIIGCLAAEMFMQWCRKRSIWVIKDGSALLTGILLAMVVSPAVPPWQVFMGGVIAIVIGKALFGGLGYNIFNPALLGRAFLQMSFPVAMTTWINPNNVSAVSTATPLALGKFEGVFTQISTLFFGVHGGCIGETSSLLLILGGVLLIVLKIVDFRIPVSIFATMAACAYIFNLIPGVHAGSILYNWFAGGAMLGAFFMATDMVTSPMTSKGKIIFGIGIGAVIMLIRVFGGLPEAVMFGILLMNGFVPIINRHTRPRILGDTKNAKQKG